jgi:hypothetical protein
MQQEDWPNPSIPVLIVYGFSHHQAEELYAVQNVGLTWVTGTSL